MHINKLNKKDVIIDSEPAIQNQFSNPDTNPEFNIDLIEDQSVLPLDEFDFIPDENDLFDQDTEESQSQDHRP